MQDMVQQGDNMSKRNHVFNASKNHKRQSFKCYLKQNGILYVMIIPAIIYFSIFHLLPIVGMRIAFEEYHLQGSNEWVGLKNFVALFRSSTFLKVLLNTLVISLMKLIIIMPIPIILSLLINELKQKNFKKYVQTIIYMPYFLSWVVIAGIWLSLLSYDGVVNQILNIFHIEAVDFMKSEIHIRWVLIFSEIWKSAGWNSIIYIATLMKINPTLYSAAQIDGANRFQQMWYITLPELVPTIVTLFILNFRLLLNAGFDQVFNLMNDSVLNSIDILDTYAYRIGLLDGQYAFSIAASLFKGMIGVILIVSTHLAAKKISGKGLW